VSRWPPRRRGASPTLGHGIALAFVPSETAIGDTLAIDVRGTPVPATVVKTPFIS
jgi:aminomethyltransferase